MDAGLFPATINVALSHGIKHNHKFVLELGASTVDFGKQAGRALIAVTAIIAITSIIKTFISRPVVVQQAPPIDRLFLEQIARDRRQTSKESSNKRESSSDNAISKAADAAPSIEAPIVKGTAAHAPPAAAI